MASSNSADKLFSAMEEKQSRVCVGLDPRLDLLPSPLLAAGENSPGQATVKFCEEIIKATAEEAAVVKVQAAYFEALGRTGWDCLWTVVERAQLSGLLVIVDAKRGDIGSTAEAYAEGLLLGEVSADAVTVNPYLGSDGVQPFIETARQKGQGVFVLVRTSNPSSGELQDLVLADSGKTVYQQVGDLVAEWGAELRGESGYSSVGAVVGATYPAQLAELRQRLPEVPFLVPGYGAQGAGPQDIVGAFDDQGRGAIVNASRSIIFAYRSGEWPPEQFPQAAQAAARQMKEQINAALENR